MSLLKQASTKAPAGFVKDETKEETEKLRKRLDELQNLLFAESSRAVLVIIQGVDASGKDGAIKKVFGCLNPQGVSVTSFKAPTPEELSHHFLWRIQKHTPARGTIKVFNRSHYEDVLITRVHGWCDDSTAQKRFEAINNFEKLLVEHNNTCVLKFYLHVSPEEQRSRLQERMDNPLKAWKFNPKDLEVATRWDDYMRMYEDVFGACNTPPWTVVPADQNWYKEYVIAKTVHDALAAMNMAYPAVRKDGGF